MSGILCNGKLRSCNISLLIFLNVLLAVSGASIEARMAAAREVISFGSPRRLRSQVQDLPPYILPLENVYLPTAKGSDNYFSYVNKVVIGITKSFQKNDVSPRDVHIAIEPSALLIFEDTFESAQRRQDYGNVIFMFRIASNCGDDFKLCEALHQMWSEHWAASLANPNSELSSIFEGRIDRNFPYELTPALCTAWKFDGPGCRYTSPAPTSNSPEEGGAPLWVFFVLIPSLSVLQIVCLWWAKQTLQEYICRRHPVNSSSTPDLQKLPREKRRLQSVGANDACSICLERPSDTLKSEWLWLPCSHYMHAACAETWLAKKMQCPICRTSVCIKNCTVLELSDPEIAIDKVPSIQESDSSDGELEHSVVLRSVDIAMVAQFFQASQRALKVYPEEDIEKLPPAEEDIANLSLGGPQTPRLDTSNANIEDA